MKVLGFDNWTGGAHNFERLVDAIKKRDLQLELIHLGSWGNDRGRPTEERIGRLLVRDISFYSKKSFLDIIDLKNPAAVIFLSTDTFAHRAFNRYCAYRRIPTLHLYHGLVRVQATDEATPHKINTASQFRFVSSRLLKAFTKVWPTYIAALWKTGAAPNEWSRFIRDIINLSLGRYISESAADAKTDRCCVYAAADIEHALKKYGFTNDEVSAVGNPDLIRFGLTSELIGAGLSGGSDMKSDIMYIDTGLIYAGATFRSAQDFLQHLILTRSSLEGQGRRLVVKLHPDHFRTSFPAALEKADIEICSNKEFVSRLLKCCAAIVEPSTASLIPALIGIPLLLAKYGKLREQCYGEVLITYPRVRCLADLRDVNTLLAEEQVACKPVHVKRWIDQNAGPLPAELMPERVTDIVEAMIIERQSAESRKMTSGEVT